MKKMIENIYEISDKDIFATAHAVSDGVWVNGFFDYLAFEAKVNDITHCDGINKSRVVSLTLVERYYSKDKTFSTTVARFRDGEWLICPNKTETRKTLETLVSQLEKLPYHEEFETKEQTA